MANKNKIDLPDFSEDTRKELEKKKKEAEKQLNLCLQQAENYKMLIENFNSLLGIVNKVDDDDEISDDSTLTPTEFVQELLNKYPDKWISVHEFLSLGREASESGEVTTRGAEIERSIHGVLSRFRRKKQVLTKGNRDSRKYKLKT